MGNSVRPDTGLFLRLPYELRLEIYWYTLVAEDYISLRDDAVHVSPYHLRQTTWEKTDELENACRYLITSGELPAVAHADAEAFLLSHNVFKIQSIFGARMLQDIEKTLIERGCPAKVRNILVVSTHDPNYRAFLLGSYNQDFRLDDVYTPGARACRLLEAVLEFKYLTRVHIRLHQFSCDINPIIKYTTFQQVSLDDQGMQGIKRVAPLIEKLRKRLPVSSPQELDYPEVPFLMRKHFTVFVTTLILPTGASSADQITHFWQPPSPEEGPLFERCGDAELHVKAEVERSQQLVKLLAEKKRERSNARKRLSRANQKAFESFEKWAPDNKDFLIDDECIAAAKLQFTSTERITLLGEQVLELGREIQTMKHDQAQIERNLFRLRRATCDKPLAHIYHRYRVSKWIAEARSDTE